MADESAASLAHHPHDVGDVARDSSTVVAKVGLAIVMVVAGIAIGLRLSGNSSAAASDVVREALASTMRYRTAALSVTETIDVEGQIGTAQGHAKCELRVDACTATLDYSGALAQLGTESMVYSNHTMYLRLAGTVGASFPTPWIWLPFKASNRPSALGSTGSPLAGLALLTRKGAVVKSDGTASVDGTSMRRYVVEVTQDPAESVVPRHESGLPHWLTDPAPLGASGARSMTLDVNGAGRIGLMAFTSSATQDGTFATVEATETVTDYGSPVTVHVPAKKELTFVDALSGTLTRYCAPAPGLRLGPSSKPIVNHR